MVLRNSTDYEQMVDPTRHDLYSVAIISLVLNRPDSTPTTQNEALLPSPDSSHLDVRVLLPTELCMGVIKDRSIAQPRI